MRLIAHRVVVRILPLLAVIAVASEMRGQQKSPVPDAKTLEARSKAARDIYGPRFTQAKTAAQKLALAKEMLDTASKVPDGLADQYALLRKGLRRASSTSVHQGWWRSRWRPVRIVRRRSITSGSVSPGRPRSRGGT